MFRYCMSKKTEEKEINIENIDVSVNTENEYEDEALDDTWITDTDWKKDTVKFVPPIDHGIVIKVYDGDTITIASKLPYKKSPIYRFTVRLNGIDCPEIKGKTENEKQCAQIAKKTLSDLILNKKIILKNTDTEKYGRILADVYIDNLHINKHMVDSRLAVSYDGGTKKIPSDWMNYYLGTIL